MNEAGIVGLGVLAICALVALLIVAAAAAVIIVVVVRSRKRPPSPRYPDEEYDEPDRD